MGTCTDDACNDGGKIEQIDVGRASPTILLASLKKQVAGVDRDGW